jgi:iron-sulfur cluster assembly protein
MSESVTNPPGNSPGSPPTTPVVPMEPKPGRGVHLTERAAKEIQRVIAEQKFPATTWVRIGAKGGGCSGFTYVLDFDQAGPSEFDLGFTQHGVNFVVDKKSEFFMGGTILDFNDGLLDRGFVFKNPLATGTCGCGTSFSA